MKSLNEEMLALGRAKYQEASGLADMERDNDGFILLKPTAKRVDDTMVSLSANIGSLEAKLKRYKEEQQKTKKIMETPEYKESKKELSKKKQKKKRESLLTQIFNNADALSDEDDEDEVDEEDGTYRDSRKGKAKAKKDAGNTLDTTYGKRFSPVVSMLYDTIADFDKIASDIEADLKSSRNSARTMYRSSQIGNMISAKNSKLSAVKELNAVAKTISDLEYKKEKDKKAEEGSDNNKAVASMAARILRGGLDEIDTSSKKGKKGKKDKKESYGNKNAFTISKGLGRSVLDEKDDDDDDSFGSVKRSSKGGGSSEQEQRELASEFANALLKNKDKIKFTAHEKHIDLEGTYTVMVLCDPLDTSDYKFVAVDKKGKILNDDVYKELLPKKKKCRLKFDISKNRATDLNSARTYKLMYKD